MRRYYLLFVIFMAFSIRPGLFAITPAEYDYFAVRTSQQDTLLENQILFNGKIWINKYSKVKEDQFLFSRGFLPGTVNINGRTFENIELRYDIYNDEIIIPTNHGSRLQLNKEMVDSFNILFNTRSYHFTNIRADSMKGVEGYVNVLYEGETTLYVKHNKGINLLGFEGKSDLFYKFHRIYIVLNSTLHLVKSRRELFKLFGDYKGQIKSYIRKNKLHVSVKDPDSIVPVVEYFDNQSQQDLVNEK